ncbi:succinate dehydrogenase / fumarate reductase cytochrome b subunit [Chitinophaga skermanii]|uniref:Succinate dehydrogenase / fumarate reductase cytochrome b subunit n=1 Tax=Chitinophaga skermanii TaxID=331697 RepID=A0A327R3S2_9BACT|nr:succinate dehydrogenase cytochrome b subunit [Chitinophaga skermanii]RAJ08527.1 succinate dehydrogenase / fumarate reductase cytochrome b subunit [Chitinophaga skermanii]
MHANTLVHKLWMAFTGLFLCFFLVIHLLGNLQLLLPAERAQLQFNAYSHLLSGNILIKIISYVLYASIILHVVYALIITLQNRAANDKGYAKDNRGQVSKWYSRNMGVLGTIILIFLVIHFRDYWYVYKFGHLPLDSNGDKDLYTLVVSSFQEGWYVCLYVLCMWALGFHLLHGFYSATRTLGVYHPKYVRWLKQFGWLYTGCITLGFTLIPIYVYFVNH